MKLYVIYQIRDATNTLIDLPILYAFTTKESLLKKFKAVRKMSIFKIFTKEISEDEYVIFRKQYHERELVNRKMYTRSEDNVHKEIMRVVATYRELEHSVLYSDAIIQEGARYTRVNVSLLKHEYIQALKTLGFFEFMKFADTKGLYPESVAEQDWKYELSDYNEDNRVFKVDLDEFTLMMYFYGYMFR